MAGQRWSKSGHVWPKITQFWPKLVEIGPPRASVGGNRANLGRSGNTICHCLAKFGMAKFGCVWSALPGVWPDLGNKRPASQGSA